MTPVGTESGAVRPLRFGLPRTARLRTQGDFRRVYGRGTRVHGTQIVAIGLDRKDAGHRLGLSVSKQNGGAVRRNKIKRMLREAFRLERPALPGAFDLILIPRPELEHRYELEALREELRGLVTKLADPEHRKKQKRRGGRGRKGQGGRKSGERRRSE